MRYLLLSSLLLTLSTGCSIESSRSQPELSLAKAQETPKPTPSPIPYQKQQLSRKELHVLDHLLPVSARNVLEQAEELELLSIAPCGQGYNPQPERHEVSKFQGCPVLKRAIIKDSASKRLVLDALYDGVAKTTGGMGCFSPRHGLTGEYQGQRVDLVICFECQIFTGIVGAKRIGGSISSLPQELFNQVLQSEGSPVGGK